MSKEIISDKQGISIIVMFILGASTVMLMTLEVKQDLWLAVIFAIAMAVPLVLIWARMHYLFPGKDLFYILEYCFGKFLGTGIFILYTWYFFHTGTLVVRNVTYFIHTVSLEQTPEIVIMAFFVSLCIYITKNGLKTIGRWAELFVIIAITFILISMLFLLPNININNIRPFLANGIKPVLSGAYYELSFPFAELVTFTMIFTAVNRRKSFYKIYLLGLLIGGLVIFAVSLTDILVLGANTILHTYFSSYAAVSRMNIRNIIQRLEVVLAIVFTLGEFLKMSVYLLATCRSITRIIKGFHYKLIVIPVALLMLNTAFILHESTMEFFEWSYEVWPFYVFPFHVAFPIIIFVVVEVKRHRLNKNTKFN
ncbi:endospore germination permease [Wukongibacter baidiensis]|uniref:GerAB/ArcD/ProY family transporter n=1 Tax=Wukongibacter baidiensis TaxID=1723361 RepID=UPI003D7FF98C